MAVERGDDDASYEAWLISTLMPPMTCSLGGEGDSSDSEESDD